MCGNSLVEISLFEEALPCRFHSFFFFCGWTPRYHGIPGNMLPVIFKHSVLTFIFTMAVVAILIALEDRIERHAARTRLTMDFLPNFNLQGRDFFACLLAVLLLNKL